VTIRKQIPAGKPGTRLISVLEASVCLVETWF